MVPIQLGFRSLIPGHLQRSNPPHFCPLLTFARVFSLFQLVPKPPGMNLTLELAHLLASFDPVFTVRRQHPQMGTAFVSTGDSPNLGQCVRWLHMWGPTPLCGTVVGLATCRINSGPLPNLYEFLQIIAQYILIGSSCRQNGLRCVAHYSDGQTTLNAAYLLGLGGKY